MGYFTTTQVFLDFPSTVDEKECLKIDKFLLLLDKSGVDSIIEKSIKNNTANGGRPNVNYYKLFATILFAFAFSKATVREIETLCRYDLRYRYLMMNECPSYSTISKFISKVIYDNQKEIFKLITKQIFKEMEIVPGTIYIDGTKIEANANKYKFVWKPLTFHKRLTFNCSEIILKYGLIPNFETPELISSSTVAYAITHLEKMENLDDNKKDCAKKALSHILTKVLEYETKEAICGVNRNSFYKTDIDATAMALKSDYYSGLGTNMHAAYNVQISVSKGVITSYHCSQSRADIHEFIDVLENFYYNFNIYPNNVCADAGYGSFLNYKYMKDRGIVSYVKHQSWEGNASGRYPDSYRINKNNEFQCLGGAIGKEVVLPNRHPKKANSIFIKFDGCNYCSFRLHCKRFMKNVDDNFKIFEVVKEFQILKQESEDNLLSVKGIEMRVNRSIQVEGVFGNIKQNLNYTRFRRRGLTNISSEIMLYLLGVSIRKLFTFYESRKVNNYWKAPSNLVPETFAKPSAKRLSKKSAKQREINIIKHT